ncbi:hypothetical protein HPQ64_17530 [Rhizobiales bacterium]|uniref:2-keto-4-pentenoate hydratase n=1 Tax=Hongsoonwoonella zoysiae TaxID=2821844 RepID=UPI001560F188|nr:fumarylacetoacetate hydrolase family protein [Hongsoonwoonella zoysiae]NRG19498.1 hypothetical protein [Hongsoonwoonella zoysiae]
MSHSIHPSVMPLVRAYSMPDARVDRLQVPPRDLQTAYRIQNEMISEIAAPVVGWKLALSTKGAQEANGLSAPTVGRLIGDALQPSGTVLAGETLNRPEVEPEIAITLSRDIPPHAPLKDRDAARAAIGRIQIAIELADSRYIDKPGMSQPEIIADNNAAAYLILGPDIPFDDLERLIASPIEVELGDGTLVEAFPPENRPDPVEALMFLSAFAAEHGLVLGTGHVVTTGTCAPPTPAAPGRNKASFGDFGTVVVTLATQQDT